MKKNKNIGAVLTMRSDYDFFILKINNDEEIECQTIQFSHGINNIPFDLGEESDGTRRILDLIEILLYNQGPKVYVVDELDRCLHPILTCKFVQKFLENLEKRDVQLIVTTHESRLMNLDLLRRDEIWFTNKNSEGC